MATKCLEEILDVPLSIFDGNVPKGFGMDIGGTLTKVAYATKEDDSVRFHFISYPKYEIQTAVTDLSQILSGSIEAGDTVFTTGVGCNEFRDVINEGLGVTIMNQTESDCNAETLRLFVKHLSLSQYVFPKSKRVQPFIEDQLKAMKALMEMMEQQETKTKAFTLGAIEDDKGLDRKLEMDDVFPCLICTLGSGAFYCTMEADGTSEMIDINTSCGRMFLGLGSLLTGAQSFDELIDLATAGDDGNVETKCKHVKSSDRRDFYSMLPDEAPIYCFGQTPGKQISDFRREDLAAALVSQLAQQLVLTCYLARMSSNVKMVFFCGGVCSQSELIRDEIEKHYTIRNTTSKKASCEFHFLKYGGYTGALGALLLKNGSSERKE